ncbi:DUF397 domain-containing protein [Streptomyces sp. cg35]|uniref:DUF397 domain-containing protein n=1 Tax=Streptomyces sp. cg35 TaxID=3421650 RepID=UPI003D17E09F
MKQMQFHVPGYMGMHKSSESGSGENCLYQGREIGTDAVGVADSKLGSASPVVKLTPAAWTAFIGHTAS